MEPATQPMHQALALAHRAVGSTSPNPAVGAVLVKDGQVMGSGFTQPPGEAHAEVVALHEAGTQAQGAAMYVTLEPCPHQGRTPPCVDAIIAAGVAEVHVAALDPNPAVNGRGKAALERAGVHVTMARPGGDETQQAQRLIEAFTKHVTTKLPFVTAKFAMSLDGKLATSTGHSQWISGDEARLEAHRLRAEADAVMVGIGTALADDPRLTARVGSTLHPQAVTPSSAKRAKPQRQPMRVVIDSHGRLPSGAAMLKEQGQTLVAVADAPRDSQDALRAAGAEVVVVPGKDGRVALPALLRLLGTRDVTSLLVEGGAELLGALFDQRLVDKVVAFVAPLVIGGGLALSPVGGRGASKVANALQLRDVRYEQVGRDMMVIGYPSRGGAEAVEGGHS